MILLDVLVGGLVLGGMYALIAIGFNLQYGVAAHLQSRLRRVPDGGGVRGLLDVHAVAIDPILGMALSVPVTFAANWLIYRC